MNIYVVRSRDRSDFLYCTTSPGLAEIAKRKQIHDEEMAGGKPSVWITTSVVYIG